MLVQNEYHISVGYNKCILFIRNNSYDNLSLEIFINFQTNYEQTDPMQEVIGFVLVFKFCLRYWWYLEFPSLRGSLVSTKGMSNRNKIKSSQFYKEMKFNWLHQVFPQNLISNYPRIPTKPAPGARPPLLTNSDNKFNSSSKQNKLDLSLDYLISNIILQTSSTWSL